MSDFMKKEERSDDYDQEDCLVVDNDQEDGLKEDDQDGKEGQEEGEDDLRDAIFTDIEYVKSFVVKAAVLTMTRDYITVVIM